MTNRLRALLAFASLSALLAAAGCTASGPAEFGAGLFKGWCRNAPEHCTVRDADRPA
ncbi:MAG: hypothetical protein JNN22_00455 [Rhodospirillales bacterium]|nr:hypothetical protein [Rhodospirillales bacterium]